MKTSVNLLKKKTNPKGKPSYIFHKCKSVDVEAKTLLAMREDNSIIRPYFEELMNEHKVSDVEVLIPASLFGGSVSDFARTYTINRPKGMSKERMEKVRQYRKKA